MGQATVRFRVDKELKTNMEQTCSEMGLDMAAAFTMFATKVVREKRIPFEVTVDPFYAEENQERLRKAFANVEANRLLAQQEVLEESEQRPV